MAQQQTAPGGHYSGHNPIPTVKQFIENLDKDKKNRDAQLDEQAAASKQAQKSGQKTGQNAVDGGAQPHRNQKKSVEGTETTVTDPTTGNQVTIADVDKTMMSEVEDPHLVVPNANLQKDTVCGYGKHYEGRKLTCSSLSKQTHISRSKTTSTTRT